MLKRWALGDDDDDGGGGESSGDDDGDGQCSGHGGDDNDDVIFPQAFFPFSLTTWATSLLVIL